MKAAALKLLIALSVLSLAGCATIYQSYSASTYPGIRIGNAQVSGDVSVSVSPSGVYVTPTVRYYQPRHPK